MTYSSRVAAYDGDGTWDIDGQLTIRDITRPVRLQAWFRGTTIETGAALELVSCGGTSAPAGFQNCPTLPRAHQRRPPALPSPRGGADGGSDRGSRARGRHSRHWNRRQYRSRRRSDSAESTASSRGPRHSSRRRAPSAASVRHPALAG